MLDEKEVEEAALRLEPRSRARLAERLLASLEALGQAEAEALWIEEAERREAELERDAEFGRPADAVFRDLKAQIG